jgi:DNA modification methylase
MDIRNGNCLEMLKTIPNKSIDLFICDLPYGETNCKWDTKIDMIEFWKEFKRVRKNDRVACIHFCSTKFGYSLIKSWEKGFKMDIVWKKRNKTGGLCSRYRPMRNHEMVYFFYDKCPKYNRDKYHKRIMSKKVHDVEQDDGVYGTKSSSSKTICQPNFEPPNPASVINEVGECSKSKVWGYNKPKIFALGENGTSQVFSPVLPASVINEVEEKDTIYNKNTIGWSSSENNKTYLKANPGYTPRQPGSVVEEKYEIKEDSHFGIVPISKEYNTKEKGLARLNGKLFEPALPASVINEVEEKYEITYDNKKYKEGEKGRQKGQGVYKINVPHTPNKYDVPNPASVIEEVEEKTTYGIDKSIAAKSGADISNMKCSFDPPNPASVINEVEEVPPKQLRDKTYSTRAKEGKDIFGNNDTQVKPFSYEPPNPASVINEVEDPRVNEKGKSAHGWDIKHMDKPRVAHFEPKLPLSVINEDLVEPAEDEPVTMYESTKVFIGKRNHQTEKPQDILEFFIKYWSDEGDTILDPTMGSGSTGVACANLNRKFIGFELDKKIFETAKKRINNKK